MNNVYNSIKNRKHLETDLQNGLQTLSGESYETRLRDTKEGLRRRRPYALGSRTTRRNMIKTSVLPQADIYVQGNPNLNSNGFYGFCVSKDKDKE